MTGRVTSIHAKNSVTGDGFNFPFIHSFLRNISTNNYEFIYVARKNRSKIHFFRIKQVCPHGYIWFSKTKSIGLKNSDESKINIYPDVFEHIVGIKFVNIFSGNF